MFEQAILSDAARGRKNRAVLAALTGQAIAVTGIILASMLAAERLPSVQTVRLFSPPPLLPDAPPVEQPLKNLHVNAGPLRNVAPRRYIVTPRLVPTRVPEPVIDPGSAAPNIGGALAQTGRIGVPNSIGMDVPIINAPPPPAVRAKTPERPSGPVRISEGVAQALLIHKVTPVYPPLARQARISGTVHLLGTIGKDGRIQELKVLGGHPLLVKAAVDAVQQWIYRPTLLNGEPVDVLAPIEVHFLLGQ